MVLYPSLWAKNVLCLATCIPLGPEPVDGHLLGIEQEGAGIWPLAPLTLSGQSVTGGTPAGCTCSSSTKGTS
jgi:hypothetical protein